MRLALLTGASLLLASGASTQTNDHVFRSWAWTVDAPSVRGAGLGGALVAVADDTGALRDNPASMASLTKAEIAGGVLGRRSGETVGGDALGPRTGLGLVAGGARFGARWALGAYATEPFAARIRIGGAALADGLADVGSVDASVIEAGAALAWRATSRLHLGARLAAVRLSLDGEYSREPPSGLAALRVSTRSGATRATGGVGVALEATPRLRLAAAFSERVRWKAEREATSPALGVVLDEGSLYEVRRPRVLSAGVSFQPSVKILLVAQMDRVTYGDIAAGVLIEQGTTAREDYVLADAWEPRAGIEVSLPLRHASLQLRVGVHGQAPGALEYVGDDATEAAAFAGAPRDTLVAAGASLATARGLRFDVAARFGGRQASWLAGLAVRF